MSFHRQGHVSVVSLEETGNAGMNSTALESYRWAGVCPMQSGRPPVHSFKNVHEYRGPGFSLQEVRLCVTAQRPVLTGAVSGFTLL